MIYKVFNVALELKQTSTNPTFTVIEGDTGNQLHVTVTDGGSALDLTGCRVIAVFSKPNGMSMQDSGVEDGGIEIGGTYNNEITISLFPSSIAPGNVECELQIYSGENMEVLVTTARFNFEANRAMMNEDVLLSTNEYPLLVDLISTVEGFVDVEAARVLAEQARVSAENQRVLEFAKWLAANATAETLPAGSPATVTLTEVSGAKRFTFGIPKGTDGSGTGDMSKSTYDTDGDGVVDKAALSRTITLTLNGWIGSAEPYTQTVAVDGILADATKQAILVAPAPAYTEAWGEAGVRCTGQGEASLTFSCSTIPESEIIVNIVILGVKS